MTLYRFQTKTQLMFAKIDKILEGLGFNSNYRQGNDYDDGENDDDDDE